MVSIYLRTCFLSSLYNYSDSKVYKYPFARRRSRRTKLNEISNKGIRIEEIDLITSFFLQKK